MRAHLVKNLLVLSSCLLAQAAVAERPNWAGSGEQHSNHHEKRHQRQEREYDYDDEHRFRIEREGHYAYPLPNPYETARQFYFNDQHRNLIRNYYVEQERRGHCPPGLAKKRNGCLPPGQAKKWVIGQRIPQGVVYRDLPPDLYYRLGQPPAGYRYVQAATDILMIAIGSGIINDVIYNLGR